MRKISVLCAVLTVCLLAAVFVPTKANAQATEGNFTYTVIDGKATVTACKTSVKGHILVPDQLGGYPVTTIGAGAFQDCILLERITISEGITAIAENAFGNCQKLGEITLPEGLTTIGAGAFANCAKLTKVSVPATITQIDGTAFENCSALSYNEFGNGRYLGNDAERYIVFMEAVSKGITTCQLHESTKVIFDKAFYECVGLTNIVIPNGVKTIGQSAFFRCNNLRKLTVGRGMATIGEKAFALCWGLTAIALPDGVETIGKDAFLGCNKLTDVVLPRSLTTIGEGAFNSCTKLQNVYYKGTEEAWAQVTGKEAIQADKLSYNASDCIHKWDEGVITTEATCIQVGEKTYTCSECQEKRTEELPMLTTHTYQNDCDPECEFCHAVREITHSYNENWSADETGHWHECAVCGEKKEVPIAHTPGAAPTETEPQTCLECGYIIQPALGHTHHFSPDWETDREGHWHGCDGCEEKGEYQTHDFENACDPDCAVCGYTRVTQHSYKTEWSANTETHWHECTGCGDKKDESAHTPGPEATETEPQICTGCGYELAPVIGAPAPTEPESDDGDGSDIIVTVIVVVGILAAAALGITEVCFLRKKRK